MLDAPRFKPMTQHILLDLTLLVTDRENQRIRKLNLLTGQVSTYAGDGSRGVRDGALDTCSFNRPSNVASAPNGDLFVTDQWNHQVRKLEKASKTVSPFAGSNRQGNQDAPGVFAFFHWPAGLAFDSAGNLYVADRLNHKIRRINPEGKVTTVAGEGKEGHQDGPAAQALFDHPYGLAFDDAGHLYISDMGNHRIRKLDVKKGEVSTVAGDGKEGYREGPALAAQFSWPRGLAFGHAGQTLYVVDQGNNRIRRLDLGSGEMSSVAGGGKEGFRDGDGEAALFNAPVGVVFDGRNNCLYVSDMTNHAIRKVELGARAASPRPTGDVVKLLFEGPPQHRDSAAEQVVGKLQDSAVQSGLLNYLQAPGAEETWALLFKRIAAAVK